MIKMMLSVLLLAVFAGSVLAGSDTLQAQRKLSSMGYDVGVADGIMGSRTRAAIKKFQGDKGISATGKLDGKTRRLLGIKPKRQGSSVQYFAPTKSGNRTIGVPIQSPSMKCPQCEVMINGRWQCKTRAEVGKYPNAPTLCK